MVKTTLAGNLDGLNKHCSWLNPRRPKCVVQILNYSLSVNNSKQLFVLFFSPDISQVLVAAHIPPGYFERWIGPPFFNPGQNDRYIQLIQIYGDVILTQVYGHTHTDSFRIFANDQGNFIHHCPVSKFKRLKLCCVLIRPGKERGLHIALRDSVVASGRSQPKPPTLSVQLDWNERLLVCKFSAVILGQIFYGSFLQAILLKLDRNGSTDPDYSTLGITVSSYS